jgi:hypothetical protein
MALIQCCLKNSLAGKTHGSRAMLCVMPFVPLSDDELARAALGARAIAYMHEQKVERSENPEMHAEQARRFRALAERFENARTPRRGA